MSLIDSAIGFFTTTVGMITGVLVIGMIGLGGYMYTKGDINSKGSVLLLRPRDRRGEYIPIDKEEDAVIHCKTRGKIKRRFIKGGSSWLVNKKPVFLAVEGSGYTSAISTTNSRTLPIDEFLRETWGDEFCNKKIPKRIAQLVSTPWLVSVEPIRIDTSGSGLQDISAEDVLNKEDNAVLEILADAAQKNKEKVNWIMLAMAMGGGMGIAYLLLGLGWLPKFG